MDNSATLPLPRPCKPPPPPAAPILPPCNRYNPNVVAAAPASLPPQPSSPQPPHSAGLPRTSPIMSPPHKTSPPPTGHDVTSTQQPTLRHNHRNHRREPNCTTSPPRRPSHKNLVMELKPLPRQCPTARVVPTGTIRRVLRRSWPSTRRVVGSPFATRQAHVHSNAEMHRTHRRGECKRGGHANGATCMRAGG
ncbi:hypothetical protein EDB85DRAFT_1900474 [Lactarius pseudohatsudake]|nr:hypothetical protein EDB85DRAFT_1900474 [Lactarius pseudohatsudake]